MSYFDDILSQFVADEADREVFKKHAGFVSKVEDIASKNAANQEWFHQRLDVNTNKTFREQELEALVAQQNEKIAAAAAGGSEMVFDDILAGLKSKGFVDQGALDSKIGEVKTHVETAVNNRDMGVLKFWEETANLPIRHKEEFGEELDTRAFNEAYTKNPTAGARAVYDSFVAQKREAKRTAELERIKADSAAAVEKARQEGIEAGRQQAAIQNAIGNGGMPVDQGTGGGAASMGWMQKRQLERSLHQDENGNQVVPGGKLGDGSATAAIMAQMQKDIASGKVQLQ